MPRYSVNAARMRPPTDPKTREFWGEGATAVTREQRVESPSLEVETSSKAVNLGNARAARGSR
jgi:hypothetical protein